MTEDKVHEEIARFNEWFGSLECENKPESLRILMQLAWLGAKEHAAKQSGWVSVEDKYPEASDTEVNVLLSDGTVRIALYQHFVPFAKTDLERSFTGDIYHIDGAEYTCQLFENVTHWQPLPASPEKE